MKDGEKNDWKLILEIDIPPNYSNAKHGIITDIIFDMKKSQNLHLINYLTVS